VLLAASLAAAAIPPKPAQYFNDDAGVVSAGDARRLNGRLRALDQQYGTQVVIAVSRRLPEGEVLEDFTIRAAQAWGAGRAKEDDGAVLFVFVDDRRTRLEVGYGLEDRLPDAVAKRILQDVMAPHFRRQNYAAGLEAAVEAIVLAVHGQAAAIPAAPVEGTPRRRRGATAPAWPFLFILMLVLLSRFSRAGRRGWTVSRGGWNDSGGGWFGGFGGGSSGGGFSDGGGFSGGGGSFGGGGASGDW